MKKAQSILEADEIVQLKNANELDITDRTKVVHIVKPVRGHRVPLLVSTAGMIYGGEKEYMVQEAEKIVYCTAEVYNKRHKQGLKDLG